MTEETQNSSDYDVGYGKPPKHTQFKKGQSGNPTGKAKKEASLKAQLKKILAEEVVVHQNGVPVTMTKGGVMLNAVVNKSMKGNLPTAKYITDTVGPEPEAGSSVPEFEVTKADLHVLKNHADWVAILEQARAECAAEAQGGSLDDGEDHDTAL